MVLDSRATAIKYSIIETDSPVKKIVLAGASGFVGTSLRNSLTNGCRWIGLTRSAWIEDLGRDDPNTSWRRCDLFSLPQIRHAMRDAEIAVYMVHSMLPSGRLVQGNFRDTDLLLADNFVRAAEEAGIKRIIYLGGLIPEETVQLSPHLASRLEVEKVLMGRSIPVTVLRSGLIFGPGGSSAQMLLNLTRRLPIMVLPKWTNNTTQSIDIRDIVRAIGIVLENEEMTGIYDLAGHPPMTYRDMIMRTSSILRKQTRYVPIPVNLINLSSRWVSLFGKTPNYLVKPLLESLKHTITARENPLLDQIYPTAIPFDQSVRESVNEMGEPKEHPRAEIRTQIQSIIQYDKRVRSIQRMPLPDGWSALQVSNTYGKWISRSSLGLIHHKRSKDGGLRLSLLSPRFLLLEFTPTPYSENSQFRRAYYITKGSLTRLVDPPGRFELRIFPNIHCLIAAIHGYKPRIPWWLYSISQAWLHLFVMRMFARYLGQLAGKEKSPDPEETGDLEKY